MVDDAPMWENFDRRRLENNLRRDVCKALAALDAFPVENSVGFGCPDVYCLHGQWIELKYLQAWPVRENTSVRIDHYTPKQRTWAQRHKHRGGTPWMLIQVGTEVLILPGEWAAVAVGTATRIELINKACDYLYTPTFNPAALLEFFLEQNNAKN
jgi:hypothetical protein